MLIVEYCIACVLIVAGIQHCLCVIEEQQKLENSNAHILKNPSKVVVLRVKLSYLLWSIYQFKVLVSVANVVNR